MTLAALHLLSPSTAPQRLGISAPSLSRRALQSACTRYVRDLCGSYRRTGKYLIFFDPSRNKAMGSRWASGQQ